MRVQAPAHVLHQLRTKGQVQGWVPAIDISPDLSRGAVKLVPFSDASLTHSKAKGETEDHWNRDRVREAEPIPEQEIQRMRASLPSVVRRTHPERLRSLTQRLLDDGLRIYRAKGYLEWPASIRRELKILGWKEGDPNLEAQVEDLARRYIVKAANEQKENDQRKVVLDHSGSYSS